MLAVPVRFGEVGPCPETLVTEDSEDLLRHVGTGVDAEGTLRVGLRHISLIVLLSCQSGHHERHQQH